MQQSLTTAHLVPLLPGVAGLPTRIATTRSMRCFAAAASSPQTRAFIDFLVEAMAPLQGPR